MHFSVLFSLYYKENPIFFRQSLCSILSQTILPDEIVLVLDGPLPEELNCVVQELQQKIPFLIVVPLLVNQGLGKALNEGLKHCRNELVARMDADDIARSNRFEKQLKVFHEHPEIDVCGAWIEEFEGNISHIVSVRKLPEEHEEIFSFAKKRNPINHPVVMFRKKAVLAAGGYQHFSLFEDYYLWVRMLMNGARFYNIQESLLFFRFSSAMFKRRGGWKYAMDEFRFQSLLRRKGFITWPVCIKNIGIRFVTRLMPNTLRSWTYKTLLRK